jgi:hypothetical protein
MPNGASLHWSPLHCISAESRQGNYARVSFVEGRGGSCRTRLSRAQKCELEAYVQS